MPAHKTPQSVLDRAFELVTANSGDITAAAQAAGMPRSTLTNHFRAALAAQGKKLEARPKVYAAAATATTEVRHDPMARLDAIAAALKAQLPAIKAARAPIDFGAQRFVITSAQNATPVSPAYWDALQTYCKHNQAQLIVIPYRYKNPTSSWTAEQEDDEWWAPEVQPYLLSDRVDLSDSLVILADIKTQPTASRPLSGFQTFSGGKSAIVGHPKLELETVPTPQHKLPKILTTTGACTLPNYSDSKAGKVGTHHHTLGAAVVELDGDAFHLRQINATHDGCFYDMTTYYMPHGVRTGPATGVEPG